MFETSTQDEPSAPASRSAIGRLLYPLSWRVEGLKHRLTDASFTDELHQQTEIWRQRADAARVTAVHDLSKEIRRSGLTRKTLACGLGWLRAAETLGLQVSDQVARNVRFLLTGTSVECVLPDQRMHSLVAAAVIATLGRVPVHVLCGSTENQQETYAVLRRICDPLSITVAMLEEKSPKTQRDAAYRQNIVVALPGQVAMDRLAMDLLYNPAGGARGFDRPVGVGASAWSNNAPAIALVDSAESVIFDQADLPVTLYESGSQPAQLELYRRALELARALVVDVHYRIVAEVEDPELTDEGRAALALMCAGTASKLWRAVKSRQYLATKALVALHARRIGEHYELVNGAVKPLEHSLPLWSRELLCLVALKEGVETRYGNDLLARTSLPRLFSEYRLLSGIGASAALYGSELFELYGVLTIPEQRPCTRQQEIQSFPTYQEKLDAIVELAASQRNSNQVFVADDSYRELERIFAERPVRVCTLAADEDLGQRLPREGVVLIAAGLLNRRSQRIARWLAGESVGQVVFCDLPPTARDSIRAARALVPEVSTSVLVMASVEDEAESGHLGEQYPANLIRRLSHFWERSAWGLRRRQRQVQRSQLQSRQQVVQMDGYLEKVFAFSGRSGY